MYEAFSEFLGVAQTKIKVEGPQENQNIWLQVSILEKQGILSI